MSKLKLSGKPMEENMVLLLMDASSVIAGLFSCGNVGDQSVCTGMFGVSTPPDLLTELIYGTISGMILSVEQFKRLENPVIKRAGVTWPDISIEHEVTYRIVTRRTEASIDNDIRVRVELNVVQSDSTPLESGSEVHIDK